MAGSVVLNQNNPIVVVGTGGGVVVQNAMTKGISIPQAPTAIIPNGSKVCVTMNQGMPGPAGQDGAMLLPPPDDPDKTILSMVNGVPTWVYPHEANCVSITADGGPIDFDTDIDGGSIIP